MFLIRVSLPDRSGTLGAVASAMGTVGADIHAVEIVAREDGRVVDDFMVKLPAGVMPDHVVSSCTTLADVEVLWCARYPGGAGLESDVEALERMLADPEQAAEIMTEACPGVFHCNWAVLLDVARQAVLHATTLAPDLSPDDLAKLAPLDHCHSLSMPTGWLPEWVETEVAVTPVKAGRAIVLGRHGGPDFMSAELARLRYLATLIPAE